jgi:hypothetical protein
VHLRKLATLFGPPTRRQYVEPNLVRRSVPPEETLPRLTVTPFDNPDWFPPESMAEI